MESDIDFQDLVQRVRQGDQQAAAQIVENYEPEVRRFIRFRLSSPSLRRTFDSLDICQSVLGRFFVEVSSGEMQFKDPGQLKALLLTMARNKLYDRVRQSHADRRDVRRITAGGQEALLAVADSQDSPSEMLAVREILAAVNEQLSDQERYLVEQRLAGREWEELATELRANAEALRKRMTRAIDGAAARLGLRDE